MFHINRNNIYKLKKSYSFKNIFIQGFLNF
nr:MAG TPA: Major fimbrial subunit protein [Bacteriophage sp.]